MEDIQSLSHQELASKLKSLGLKSGPIMAATRKVFENVLRRYYAEQCQTNREASAEDTVEANNEACTDNSQNSNAFTQEQSENSLGGNSCINGSEPSVYYSICRSVQESSSDSNKNENPLVYTSLTDALAFMKSIKNSRLKSFSTRSEAECFSVSSYDEPINPISSVNEQGIPYKSPTPQDLTIFRKKVEFGALDEVKSLVYSNPKYLFSSIEMPVILQEGCRYNAMHIAVKSNKLQMCKLVIEILNDEQFWKLMFPNNDDMVSNKIRKARILDYFVNNPDKGAGDTPLHLACKFGYADIVKYLVSLPFCETEKVNKAGDKPIDVVCSRKGSEEEKIIIVNHFEASVCVPLLRAEDDSVDPLLGDPVPANASLQTRNSSIKQQHNVSPLNPKLIVRACAGPMSPKQADDFLREWRSPQRRSFMNDFEKGKERIGRKLAFSHKVPWTEYWSFLGCFADLKTDSGLDQLEQYLLRQFENYRTREVDNYATPARNRQFQPWKQSFPGAVARKLHETELELSAKLSIKDEAETASSGSDFPSSPTAKLDDGDCKKRLFEDFSRKSPTDKISCSVDNRKNKFSQELGEIDANVNPLENSIAVNQNLANLMQSLSLDDKDSHSKAGMSCERTTILDDEATEETTAPFLFLGESLSQTESRSSGISVVEDMNNLVLKDPSKEGSGQNCPESLSQTESRSSGISVVKDMKKLLLKDTSKEGSDQDSPESATKPRSMDHSVFRKEPTDLDLSYSSVFADSPVDITQREERGANLKHGNVNFKSFGRNVGAPLFIKGLFPSKVDFDVHRALEDVEVDRSKYPCIASWMNKVDAFSNEDRNLWPSPCSPRYRSKLRQTDAMWSL